MTRRAFYPGDSRTSASFVSERIGAVARNARRLELAGPPGQLQRGQRVFIVGRIDSATGTGTSNQWTYAFTQMKKTNTGYTGWTVDPDGITGTAYNYREIGNGASGVQGNGVDLANLSGTFAVQPITTGTQVFLERVLLFDTDGENRTGAFEWWFDGYNAVDGACP